MCHIGVPYTMEGFFQETEWAGWIRNNAMSVVYYNSCDMRIKRLFSLLCHNAQQHILKAYFLLLVVDQKNNNTTLLLMMVLSSSPSFSVLLNCKSNIPILTIHMQTTMITIENDIVAGDVLLWLRGNCYDFLGIDREWSFVLLSFWKARQREYRSSGREVKWNA